ncbi:MAG: hypothetical protein K0R66_57 [Gammaproteobacteria bacterium]|jgi:drug/metabolite transporter (DMT)-like permease|nr:hypothetical protein [Gammaproteobacteria bacterium]
MLAWFWLAISASALWGLTYVASQYILKSLDPLHILWLSSLVVFFGLGAFFLMTGQGKSLFSKLNFHHPKLVFTVIAYAILYLAASILILKSINAGNATLAALIESAYPLFTMAFAYFFLKQVQFNWGIIIGCGFLLVGLALIQIFSSSVLK